jgi:hypothetical protein
MVDFDAAHSLLSEFDGSRIFSPLRISDSAQGYAIRHFRHATAGCEPRDYQPFSRGAQLQLFGASVRRNACHCASGKRKPTLGAVQPNFVRCRRALPTS